MARTFIAVPVDPARAEIGLGYARETYDEHMAERNGYTGPPRILRLRDKQHPCPHVFRAEVSMKRRTDGGWDTTTELFGEPPVRLIVHCGNDPKEAAANALSSAIDDREDES
jgi:hypothetical protein